MNQPLKPVKGIFFDLGWTLLYPPSGDWMFSFFARRYFSEETLSALPPERVRAALAAGNAYLNSHHRLDTLEEEYDQFFHYYSLLAQALPELGLEQKELEAITQDKVYNLENYALFPDSLNTLNALWNNYRIGVISDTWPSIVPVLERFGLLPYFHTLTFSYKLGVYKPHPAMYQDALDKLGIPPEELVPHGSAGEAGAAHKAEVIRRALAVNRPDPSDPLDILAKVGGLDLAALCGFFLGCAALRIAAMVDGCSVRCPDGACRPCLSLSLPPSGGKGRRLAAGGVGAVPAAGCRAAFGRGHRRGSGGTAAGQCRRRL